MLPYRFAPRLIFNGENALTPMRHGWWLASIGRLKPGWTLGESYDTTPVGLGTDHGSDDPDSLQPESVKKYMYRLGPSRAATDFPGCAANMKLRFGCCWLSQA